MLLVVLMDRRASGRVPFSYLLMRLFRSRPAIFIAVILVLVGILIPLGDMYISSRQYSVPQAATSMLGELVPKLDKKITFDGSRKMYQFNQAGESSNNSNFNPASFAQQKQVGANKADSQHLYSADIPQDLSRGITYYDNQQGVSFSLTPDFGTLTGQMKHNRLVYPLKDVAGQAVYTVQNNGLREDILVNGAVKSGTVSLGYHLTLPNTLEARAIPDTGAIGIYSADASLFGNISYGSSSDQQLVLNARQKSAKNNLVFTIPSPVIHTSGKGSTPTASMTLTDTSDIQIAVSGLDGRAHYPLDIDPSVVVNSTSGFVNGNNEGNIDFGTNQISRGAVSGATVSAGWTDNTFTTGRQMMGVAAYNGYLYIVGGKGSAGNLSDIQYATINPTGTLSAFASTTGLSLSARYGMAVVAYSGYLYVLGGYDGTTYYATGQSARLNSNGTISAGAWQNVTNLPAAGYGFGVATYNDKLYILGGYNGTTFDTHAYYASMGSSGLLSAWTTSGNTFTNGRYRTAAVAYNGYLYLAGGSGAANYNDVQYAQINSDGSISAWITTSSFSAPRYGLGFTAKNGYLYVLGGYDGTTYFGQVNYAPINANGSVSAWTGAGSATQLGGRWGMSLVSYRNSLYAVGGYDGTAYDNDAYYAPVDGAGALSISSTLNAATTSDYLLTATVYNGYIYYIGGNNATTQQNTIYYDVINADGTLGTWATGTALFASLQGPTAFASNGYLYVTGGYNGTTYATATEYVPLNASTGAPGATWTNSTALPTGLAYLSSVYYNDYVYIIGGSNASTHSSTVYYDSVSRTGGLGASWSTTNGIGTGRDGIAVTQYGNKIYALGGNTGSGDVATMQFATVQTNGTLSTWTTSANSFTTVREKFAAFAVNGYLYIVGGTNTGSNFFSDIQYAQIQSSGDIGTWTTSANTLANARFGFGYAQVGQFLYILGGDVGGTVSNNVERFQVNNGGLGTVSAWNSPTNQFNLARYDEGTFAYNGNLYVIGGWDGTNFFTGANTTATGYAIQYAAIGANGNLGVWQLSATALTKARQDFGCSIYNGYVYITGGSASNYTTNDYSDTQYISIAAITSTTVAGTWTTASAVLTDAGTSYAALGPRTVTYNGYLYGVGGVSASSVYHTSVGYASLNANGSTSTFANTTSYPSAIAGYDMAIAAYNGYFYIMGGNNDTVIFDQVYYTTINANGTLGSTWTQGPSLPAGRYDFDIAFQNGYLYMMGGLLDIAATMYSGSVYSAPINANGSLGYWAQTITFPNPRSAFRAATYNGWLYISGGADNVSNYFTNYTTLNLQPHVGHYSTMLDLGAPASIFSTITTAGTAFPTTISTSYAAGGSTGTLGTIASTSTLNTTSCGYSQGTSRYGYMFITIDDSGAAAFADALGPDGAVTNITLNYYWGRAPTASRLRGGKYFSNQTAIPLDTCGP